VTGEKSVFISRSLLLLWAIVSMVLALVPAIPPGVCLYVFLAGAAIIGAHVFVCEIISALSNKADKSEDLDDEISDLLKTLLETLEYWEGIAECECKSTRPIGGCLKCDMLECMETVKKIMIERDNE